MVLLMPTSEKLRPLERKVLEVLQESGDEWVTREQVSQLVGRPAKIHPSDIAALDRLVSMGLIEAREAPRGAVGVRWEYRISREE